MKHYNLTVSGRVQRVGFRFSAMEMAVRYSINGFVANRGYDQVYIEAEGPEDNLEQFVTWCRKGPLGSRVEHVEVEEAPLKDYTRFDITERV